jgi:plastocyanin
MNPMRFLRAVAVAAAVAGPAFAGSVTGTVTFEGDAPAPKQLKMDIDPKCCPAGSEPKFSEALVLGEGQTMANVLVRITKGLPEAEHPVPQEPVVLTQEGCVYKPHVFVVRAGQTLKILNPDGTFHNVHALPKKNKAFNRAMPPTVTEIEHVFSEPEDPFMFKCNVHEWMGAWCAVLDHPYYDVTDNDGAFTIDGLDPGDYEVTVWHERLGLQAKPVTIGPDGAARVDFVYALAKK